ncbi:MAG: GAF domain-containing protein [Leptospirales bacterium]|nr:GAF domain-containing protein [Leptospirales bacterium]
MKRIVIIPGAEEFLDFSACKMPVDVSITDLDAIADEKDESLIALIFTKFEDYERIYLKCKEMLDFLHSFVIFGALPGDYAYHFEELHMVSDVRVSPLRGVELEFTVNKAFKTMEALLHSHENERKTAIMLENMKRDQDDLINIGRFLSIEKDPQKLLSLILYLSKKITGADAGSIYLVEKDENGEKRLRFKVSETFGRNIALTEFVMPLNEKSIAGYVGVTAKVLNIPDVYRVDELNLGLTHNTSYDENNDYITRSMLVVPMLNYIDEVIGIIQLINSKEDNTQAYDGNTAFKVRLDTKEDFDRYVVPFNEKYNELLQAIASQAAIAIENNMMMIQIQTQFEEFVKASVNAVEARDPATSGHSFRVAAICVALAKAVNEIREGYLGVFNFNDTELKELEFAAILHDFGKVYIDLNIFQKEKKLFPKDMESLMMRLDYFYRCVELSSFTNGGKPENQPMLEKIKNIKEKIKYLNEPNVLDASYDDIVEDIIKEAEAIPCYYPDGHLVNIFTESDKENLNIKRGTLNLEERKEIETHVIHTYNFVKRIPWPPGYENIPEIAVRHHEKLNGEGYPDGLKGRDSTMLQARIMAIADIYDALASSDRPYKKSVPRDKIMQILREEANNGVLDPDLVDVFINKKIYTVLEDSHSQA